MKKIETWRDMQKVSTYIYNALNSFCVKNGLKVYLFGGSLIGAVRHKGYIPWDDDIDVAMSRPDYQKMLELSDNKWISDKCRIVDPMTDEAFKGYIPLAVYDNSKLTSKQYKEKEELKISISIFVYDGAPSGWLSQKIYYARVYMLRAEHALCRADFKNVNTKPAKLLGPVLSPFYKPEDVYKYKKKIIEHARKYDYEKSKSCACNCDYQASREVFDRASFDTPVELDFEGMTCYSFKHYKEHLARYYGDYMQLPPEEARKPKHGFEAWIEDEFDYSIIQGEK